MDGLVVRARFSGLFNIFIRDCATVAANLPGDIQKSAKFLVIVPMD
jgi:hypothetical protein